MAFRKVESARPHIRAASASVIHSSCIFMPPSPAGTARQVFVFRGRGEIVFYWFRYVVSVSLENIEPQLAAFSI